MNEVDNEVDELFTDEDICIYAAILCDMAQADGSFDDCERDYIEDTINAYAVNSRVTLPENLLGQLNEIDQEKKDIWSSNLSPVKKRMLMQDLLTLAKSDGDYSSNEHKLIGVLAEKFNLGRDLIDAMTEELKKIYDASVELRKLVDNGVAAHS